MSGIKGGSGVSRFTPPRKVQKPRPPNAIARGTRVAHRSGPGDAPPGFVTATTSLSEWYIYWAFLVLKGKENYNSWGFQVPINGRSAIVDFMVWDQEPRLAIRIQTERWHIAAPSRVQMYDERSKRMLERMGYKVIDIYEQNFIKDKSGRAAIMKVKMALKGQQDPNPITAPTSLARPGRTY